MATQEDNFRGYQIAHQISPSCQTLCWARQGAWDPEQTSQGLSLQEFTAQAGRQDSPRQHLCGAEVRCPKTKEGKMGSYKGKKTHTLQTLPNPTVGSIS